jgi:hypothetical protein
LFDPSLARRPRAFFRPEVQRMAMNLDLAKWAVRGDKNALMFLAHIHDIAHIADDIVDGDVDDAVGAMSQLLSTCLVTLPFDQFYVEHFHRLNPLISSAITHWSVATRIERSKSAGLLDRAFVLRSLYATLTVMAAEIVAGPIDGPEWTRAVAERVWASWTDESVSGYIAEHMRQDPPPPPAEATD